MKFSDYPIADELKQSLQELGFKKPTDIQFKAIKAILDGEDVMAVAQTGTGKTAAFVIPVLHRITRSNKKTKGPKCLVMVPTRELAVQISEVFHQIGKHTKAKTLALIGGVEQDLQIRRLLNGIDVLVATPGRMFDLISQGYLIVTDVQVLVLDEADLMLDFGFSKDISDIKRKLPGKHQTLFFSATLSKKIKKAAYDVVRNAIRIQISPKNPVNKNIEHAVVMVEMDDKRFFLENFINEYPELKILVFVRTKVRAERVLEAMKRVHITTELMHGGKDQSERFEILNRFRSGENRVLITTDVAARGIDIPDVDYVLNYDLPDDPENYVHRCGRTGRGRRKGQALAFCSSNEAELLLAIEAYTGSPIQRYELSANDYQAIVSDSIDPDYDWHKLLKDDQKSDEWES